MASGASACPSNLDELGRRIVLAYTGASRQSGINNWDVMVRRINGDAQVITAFDGIRAAAAGMRSALERGDWSARRASSSRTSGRIELASHLA